MISDERFRKRDHLLKTKDFSRLYKKGRSCKNDYLVMYHLANDLAHSRIGFSISSRKVRLATDRNRVRRILREVFRKHKNDLKTGYDIVIVVVRNPAPQPDYSSVEQRFLKLARTAAVSL